MTHYTERKHSILSDTNFDLNMPMWDQNLLFIIGFWNYCIKMPGQSKRNGSNDCIKGKNCTERLVQILFVFFWV